jgi:predicted PurR-regulated permease PerM
VEIRCIGWGEADAIGHLIEKQNMNNLSRYLVAAIGLAIFGYLVWYFSDLVGYILIAWVLSMIGKPIMDLLSRVDIKGFTLSAPIRAIITIICFFVGFGLLAFLFVPLVLEQAQNLRSIDYAQIAHNLQDPIEQFNKWLSENGLLLEGRTPVEQVRDALGKYIDPNFFGNLLSSLVGIAGGLFVGIFSVTFITFFFLKEEGLFLNAILAATPTHYETQVRNAVADSSRLLSRYFTGILLQVTIITCIVWLGLTLLGVPNALFIGLFAALMNVIPYVGPIIGAVFGMFITISSNIGLDFYSQMLPLLLKVGAVFACMQLIDNMVLQPVIFSNRVSAHPLEIFIVILVGSKLGGIMGMVLAIPTYTVLRVVASIFLSEFEVVQKLTKGIKKDADT